MNRRSFIRLAGASTAFAIMGGGARGDEGGRMINRDMLRWRNQNRSTVVCRNGIVCTSQPLASMAGIDILKAGGNAIDAALCANAMLGLVEPASNGIGGDLFAIVWIEKDRKLYGLNASGRSPYDWDLDVALALGLERIPRKSAMSWSVPGCVSGWDALNRRFGKLRLSKILEPAIEYAQEGFPLSPLISGHFKLKDDDSPTLAKVFNPDGKAPDYGDIFKNPLLARSYERIAQGGARAFYEGEIAERIVAAAREHDGRMSLKDLKDHEANWVEPVSTNYRGYDVWEIPPNGQGICVLQILNMLETFDIGALEPNSAEHLHLFIEVKKLAFEDRAVYYADPDFADVPVDWLISKDYGRQRAALIDPKRASDKPVPGDPDLGSDTVYLTAADRHGNMISLIQSNYDGWGSTICPEGLGFPIQNRGQSFALDPNHRNKLEPHKRPFHTIIPAFMTRDGAPVWSFGVMGGDFQPQGHAQVVMNVVDFGMSPQQAGDQPRIRHYGSSEPTGDKIEGGGRVGFERNFPESVKIKLAGMGHRFHPDIDAHGGYQSIWREEDPRRYFGGSDPRKDGCAIGY